MTIWALFATVALAQTCTPAKCVWGEDTDDICMSRTDEALLLKSCSGQRNTCPISAESLKGSELRCEYWLDYQMWASDSWTDYLEFSLKDLGETCEPDSLLSQCDYGSDLVCYCSPECICVEGIKSGDECSTFGVPCVVNNVCNLKECTFHYTLGFGDQVDNVDACSGGSVTYNYDGTGLCIVGYETFGGIPHKCTTDLDCISFNGLKYSECVCGLNEEGDGYCSLHFEDQPMIDLRQAQEDKEFEDQVYYRFITENYPLLQGTLPECLPNVWRDYGAFFDGDWAVTLTSSIAFALIF